MQLGTHLAVACERTGTCAGMLSNGKSQSARDPRLDQACTQESITYFKPICT